MPNPTSPLWLLAASYICEMHRRGVFGAGTLPGVRWHLRSFCRFAGNIGPEQVTAVMVEAWLAEDQLARSTLRHRLSWFRGWARWMVRHGHMPADPSRDIRTPKMPRPVARSLPVEDVSKVVIATGDDLRLRLVVLLMAQEGLRCCEVARAETGDVDWEARTVWIRGKGDERRLLPISDETWEALQGYVRRRVPGPLIRSHVNSTAGLSPAYVSLLVSKTMEAAGVIGSAHALRHSMAAHMLREGRADLRDVQLALGHASLITTSVYLPHTDLNRLRMAMGGRRYAGGSTPGMGDTDQQVIWSTE